METKDVMYYAELCKARNLVRKMTRKLEKQLEMKLAAEAKSNPKAIWKYINSKTKTRVSVSELNTDPADPTSKLTTSDKEKAEVLGQFFSSVFTVEPDGYTIIISLFCIVPNPYVVQSASQIKLMTLNR